MCGFGLNPVRAGVVDDVLLGVPIANPVIGRFRCICFQAFYALAL